MKAILICCITIICLLSGVSMAMADVLRVEPQLSWDNLRIEGGIPNYSISNPILKLGLNSEMDLGLIRLGLDLGYGGLQSLSLLTVTPRAGWEFGILDYRFKIYEGYRNLRLIDANSSTTTYDFSGLLFETAIESKVSEMFAWTAALSIPETASYRENGVLVKDGAPDIFHADWSIGLKFTPLPLYDILVNYHATDVFENNRNFEIASNGLTASINITY